MYMMCALILLSVLVKFSIEGLVQLIHLSLSFTYIVIIKNKLDSFFPGGGRGALRGGFVRGVHPCRTATAWWAYDKLQGCVSEECCCGKGFALAGVRCPQGK